MQESGLYVAYKTHICNATYYKKLSSNKTKTPNTQ